MKHLLVLTTVAAALTLAACQVSDPALTVPQKPAPPAKNYDTVTDTVHGDTIKIDNRLDVLLIVDNSDSMFAHTESLSRGIGQFVDQFARNKNIDFHIGYTFVHDRIRYTKTDVPEICGVDTSAAGRVNWENPGTLKELKKGNVAQLVKEGRRYVTQNDDFRGILKANLDPGSKQHPESIITPYVFAKPGTVDKKDPQHRFICNEGPENEESFTPLLGALTNPIVTDGANKGFRRPGAFFVAIIISDAKDESVRYGLDPVTVANKIAEATGDTPQKRRARVFSVVISSGTKISGDEHSPYCKPDPAFALRDEPRKGADGLMHDHYIWETPFHEVKPGENPLELLAQQTMDQGPNAMNQVFNICSKDYGTELAKYGTKISQDTVSDQVIPLSSPRQEFADATNAKAMHVKAGNDELVEGRDWNYNPNGPSIILYSSRIQWNNYASHEITFKYTPVDLNSKDARPLNK